MSLNMVYTLHISGPIQFAQWAESAEMVRFCAVGNPNPPGLDWIMNRGGRINAQWAGCAILAVYEAFTCHGSHFTLRSALAHVHTPYLYLRNGLADCAQICCEFVTQSAVTQSVCAVGGLRYWRFAQLAVCAVGGLRGWRFARLAVCAVVGGLRGWRFAQLAVCAIGDFARWAVCVVGGLRD